MERESSLVSVHDDLFGALSSRKGVTFFNRITESGWIKVVSTEVCWIIPQAFKQLVKDVLLFEFEELNRKRGL